MNRYTLNKMHDKITTRSNKERRNDVCSALVYQIKNENVSTILNTQAPYGNGYSWQASSNVAANRSAPYSLF